MRTRYARLSVLTALIVPVGAIGAFAAPASAEGTTCSGNSGSIKISPGLEETARAQTISIKGMLTGCTGSVTSASYRATLKTAPVTCAALKSTGEPATATNLVIKWGHGNSHGTFSMPLTEMAVSIGGTIESGPFEKLSIAGTVTQSYGACGGGGKGKMKPKKLKKGTFTGSAVVVS
jgi:hypothetical protein